MKDLENARLEKATEEHNVIDDAIAERGEGYTVFSIVRGFCIFRSFHSTIEACWYFISTI
jgi:hypothetical protein